MPDQSSAATEHAILQEITAPLETLPDDPVAMVNADFPGALRGYDRMAVDAYVQRASRLVAELQATRSPDAAVRRALERVGEQISGILQRAHDTAEQITAQSRSEAEDRVQKSRAEAAELAAAARQRVSDLDADTDRIWAERNRIVEDARELAGQLLALADTAAERFPPAPEPTPYDEQAEPAPVPVPVAVDADAGPEEELYEDETIYEDEPVSEADEVPADDVDATVAFQPLEPSEPDHGAVGEASDDPAAQAPPARPARDPRRANPIIPPASQAANRRTKP